MVKIRLIWGLNANKMAYLKYCGIFIHNIRPFLQAYEGTNMNDIESFRDFWPYYLREHSQPATRFWHYIGTGAALILLFNVFLSQNFWMLPGALVCGYAFAWASHCFIEKNKPATFKYPLWSLVSDFKMLFCFMTGQMGKELRRAGLN